MAVYNASVNGQPGPGGPQSRIDPNTGQQTYLNPVTGQWEANPQPGYGGQYQAQPVRNRRPEDIFTEDAIKRAKVPNNPFKEGTKEYNDYQRNQIKNMVEKAGSPEMPDFVSQLGDDGLIKKPYQLTPGGIKFENLLPGVSQKVNGVNVNQEGLNAIRTRALSQGPSAWLNLQMQKQGIDELSDVERAKQQSAGNQAQAESALAMRGGISSGARERLARSGASNALAQTQGIRRGGSVDRLGLQIADDQTKTGLLTQLPGMENQQAQFDLGKQTWLGDYAKQQQGVDMDSQKYNSDAKVAADKYNIGNSLNETLQKRAYDQGKYGEAMKAWAAGKSADAQANAGKK
jgi:hypothetical protein